MEKMTAMRFQQVQRFILEKKIFWGWGHFNVLKTKCLFTGARHKISQLLSEPHICRGDSVERIITYKCLGVQVNETLSREVHI